MSKFKDEVAKKRRTQEHIIADLGVNHAERQVFLAGFSVERIFHDYGLDLILFTYDSDGLVEPGQVLIQVKATEHLRSVRGGAEWAYTLESADIRSWLEQPLPVILIVYEAATDRAWWLHVQAYFAAQPGHEIRQGKKTTTVRIPQINSLNAAAVQRFAGFKWADLKRMHLRVFGHD